MTAVWSPTLLGPTSPPEMKAYNTTQRSHHTAPAAHKLCMVSNPHEGLKLPHANRGPHKATSATTAYSYTVSRYILQTPAQRQPYRQHLRRPFMPAPLTMMEGTELLQLANCLPLHEQVVNRLLLHLPAHCIHAAPSHSTLLQEERSSMGVLAHFLNRRPRLKPLFCLRPAL